MKNVSIALLVFLCIVAGITAVHAAKHEASREAGKALFNDAKLGTSGKTCNDCHKNGKGLEKAGSRTDLEQMVNNCIAGPLKGTPLQIDSVEMKSIVLYIKSLKKKAPVGC